MSYLTTWGLWKQGSNRTPYEPLSTLKTMEGSDSAVVGGKKDDVVTPLTPGNIGEKKGCQSLSNIF